MIIIISATEEDSIIEEADSEDEDAEDLIITLITNGRITTISEVAVSIEDFIAEAPEDEEGAGSDPTTEMVIFKKKSGKLNIFNSLFFLVLQIGTMAALPAAAAEIMKCKIFILYNIAKHLFIHKNLFLIIFFFWMCV